MSLYITGFKREYIPEKDGLMKCLLLAVSDGVADITWYAFTKGVNKGYTNFRDYMTYPDKFIKTNAVLAVVNPKLEGFDLYNEAEIIANSVTERMRTRSEFCYDCFGQSSKLTPVYDWRTGK